LPLPITFCFVSVIMFNTSFYYHVTNSHNCHEDMGNKEYPSKAITEVTLFFRKDPR
jgi:hypothetical protein